MFTGLIEEIGKIKSIAKETKSARITVDASEIMSGMKIGDSVCTNGVCLTVTEFNQNSFSVDVMAETMRCSNLGGLKQGSCVNLERALRASDRLGGHIVSGHIDGLGTVVDLTIEENATWVSVETSSDILKYIVHKGSIAIDGISLTVAYVDENIFKVSIIPHTKGETTLVTKKIGEVVNLESDIMAKYVEKLLQYRETPKEKKSIGMDFLEKNGFV
ncbi:riboflavin synthase [Clostridium estertheticum]|uniref:riboflavin synthase n=1 Tax=Clostridium estertheticum TaxID=238834 RepID=UPI001C6EC36D|nr:riboflavin synthase [Clostridium estertheticum]MBW9151214.1 riboflavin synthase [Clostridium estertheticum]WLC84800.1 riboflavin synthase [Clostridium estertheticum]